jgi:putative transcriptional regulator
MNKKPTKSVVPARRQGRKAGGRTDWARVDAQTDADIRRAVATDPDSRVLTVRELASSYRVPEAVDVRRLRVSLRMSQGAFARKYGLSVDAVQDWEQHRVRPSQSARVLLAVIAHEPEAVERALRVAGPPVAPRRPRRG